MSFTAIENNNILIDLTIAALSTGWSVDGSIATHESCNSGNLFLLNYPLTIGQQYRYTYEILTITSGIVKTNFGIAQTSPGTVDEVFIATTTQLSFFSDGNCSITNFSIENEQTAVNPLQQNTIAFCEKLNKWTSFYSFIPDSAFSLFTNTYSFFQGNAFLHEANTAFRCNFYGVQYPSTIFISTNEQPSISKKFIELNYQANQLLITPPSGIVTQNGQVSELIPIDFQQEVLADNISPSIFIYSVEGLFRAPFLRSFPDIINGDTLIGNYMTIGLQTTSPSSILSLFTTEIKYVHSYQNIR